jgi:hypothetical protein
MTPHETTTDGGGQLSRVRAALSKRDRLCQYFKTPLVFASVPEGSGEP